MINKILMAWNCIEGESCVKSVSVIGLGYIGLPTAALIANNGFQVYGMDPVKSVVDTINQGRIHIVEPGLEDLVKKAVGSGRLAADIRPHEADVFILAVPTPFKGNKKPDLSYVEAAAREIAPYLREENIVILESTSPVGTTEKVRDWIFDENCALEGRQIYFAHCPERVLPGKVVQELSANDRIIGGVDELSTKKAVEFYSRFIEGALLETDAKTAELSKLTENSFRDVNIAFANELSVICEKLGINVWELIRLANRHPRVNILQPGPGVGGHCIAVDPWFIVDSAPAEARLIRTARQVNDNKPHYVMAKVFDRIKDIVKETDIDNRPKIACLGLAFKPDIDDLRESPALQITVELAFASKAQILAVEPNVHELPKQLHGMDNVIFMDYMEAVKQADIVLLLVDHKEFRAMDTTVLQGKIVIDTKGIWM